MQFKVGDIVKYDFYKTDNKYDQGELGQIIKINGSNCIVNFIVFKKYRLYPYGVTVAEPMNTIQEISYYYLSKYNINEFINNIDHDKYYIELHRLINLSDTKFTLEEPRIVPLKSSDAITFEDIKNGDILVDFIRNDNKTEYYYHTYYKESTMEHILKTMKNPFTNANLIMDSIVKYPAIVR
jgi:hypothetical protein